MLLPPRKLFKNEEDPYGCSTVPSSAIVPAGSFKYPSTPPAAKPGPQLEKNQPKDWSNPPPY